MGPCPSGESLVLCPFSTAFNSGVWFDMPAMLPPLGGQNNTVTVSGFSGGGTTASNLGVVHSDFIKGVGLIHCGPYGDLISFGPDVDPTVAAQKSIDLVTKNFKRGLIDDPSNLKDEPIFIFSGSEDKNYFPGYQEAQRQFYNNYGAYVEFVSQPIGHTPPSIFEQSSKIGPKNGLKYDLAGDLLRHLFTHQSTSDVDDYYAWAPGDTEWKSKGVLKKFHQSEFLDTLIWEEDSLATYGYVYYPFKCYDGSTSCKVHMFLHGCTQTVDGPWLEFEDLYYGGWLEYAAADDIIMLFPQAVAHAQNPAECFEAANLNQPFDTETFLTKNGIQMQALRKMLERVTEPLDMDYNYGARNILALDDTGFFFFDTWRFIIAFPSWLTATIGQGLLTLLLGVQFH